MVVIGNADAITPPQVKAAQNTAKSVVNSAKATTKTTAVTPMPSFAVTPAQMKSIQANALKSAQSQADVDISSQVTPLQAQIDYENKLGTQQQSAITSEFNQLLPYSQQAAAMTGAFNQQASSDAQQVFQSAQAQLNAQQQNAASAAQNLAQQTGGPVSTGQFTDVLSPYQTAMGQSGAIGQLATLQLGQIGTDQANQFSGQVLPAMAAEQHATVRNTINDQIQQLRSQITQIEGTKSKLVNAALPGLVSSQLKYYTDQLSLSEKAWKDQQSVVATNRKLDTADNALALNAAKLVEDTWEKGRTITIAGQKESFNEWLAGEKLNQTDVNNTVKNWLAGKKLDLDGQKIVQQWTKMGLDRAALNARIAHMSNQDKATAARLGISAGQLALGQTKLQEQASEAAARIQVQAQKNTNSLISGVFKGSTSTKPVSITQKHYLNDNDPLAQQAQRYATGGGFLGTPPKNVFFDPKANNGQGGYYTYIKTTETPAQYAQKMGSSGTPMSDPNAIYKFLMSSDPNMDPKMAIAAIQLHLGLPKWQPGMPANYTTATLNQMSLPDLTDLAIAYGFPASPRAVGKQRLIDYIQTSLGMKGGKTSTQTTKPAAPGASTSTTGTTGVNSYDPTTYPSMAGP
jgi:hypothetical protein